VRRGGGNFQNTLREAAAPLDIFERPTTMAQGCAATALREWQLKIELFSHYNLVT
jgi:hypothetical protein